MLVKQCYEAKNSIDNKGKTPLDLAYQNKHTIIMQYDKEYTITLFTDKKNGKDEKVGPKDFDFIMPLG